MFNFIKNEHEILKLWRERDVFSAMRDKNKSAKETFRFLDGPITANNAMGVHHICGRTLKDAQIKYNTLKGRRTHFQNGFDAQGMWVEVEVEKELGLNDKKAILEYGLANFTKKCIERVNHFADIQTRQSIRLGQIMDWSNSYFTNSDHNIECIWNFLKVCHGRGMLVRSYKSMPWCPRCGTSLSEHEMNGSYRDFEHKAVFVKVPLISEGVTPPVPAAKNIAKKILVWTTTPWTLSSNVAIAVNPNHTYVSVELDGELIIVGKEAVKTLRRKDAKIIDEFKGEKLLGMTFEPILPLEVQEFTHTIIPWDAVSATDGTGAVHIAPGCGAEDFELGKKYGLKQIVPINEAGIFTEEFEYLAGLSTEKCEEIIFNKLRENNALFYVHDYKHSYPFCWRCKTNVVFKLVDGWDIATAKIRPELLAAAQAVKWDPPFLQKTMEHWLENMGDWNISRRRFYGLPLPIYPCDCGHIIVVGSKAELKKIAISPEAIDKIPHLHRPYIDEIAVKCKCGKSAKRVPDVGDCWLDAGIAPFSTAAKDYFPSQVVIEMKEQIRLWFYSMLFMSVVLTGKVPYQKVVGHGMIVDEDGSRFSKSGVNNIKADEAAEMYGADPIRYLFASGNPAHDVRFGPNLIDEARRKLLAFYNAFVFYDTYAAIDKPDVKNHVPRDLDVTDLWLVEVLNNYIKDCEASYEDYKLYEVVSATEKLVEDLSNFYIRVNRRRFWKNDGQQDKLNAYWVLHAAIKTITLVMAPITPFLSEHIWQKLGLPGLCMAADFPIEQKVPLLYGGVARTAGRGGLISKISFAQQVISLALSLRARENLKLRQPLRTLYVKTIHNLSDVMHILQEEVNVKKVEIVQTEDKFNVPYLAVNFKRAGAVLKGDVQKLKDTLATLDDVAMARAVAEHAKGKVTMGEFKNLAADLFDRKLKSKPEFVSETAGDLTVVLDTTLDEELIQQGILREIIRAVQVERQQQNLDITARIKLTLGTNSDQFAQVIKTNKEKICAEVLALGLELKKGKNELEIGIGLA